MGCTREVCTADKIFIFINIAFAMYSGALLATAARLAWDPSTYTWFRFLCEAQYRASCAYVLAAGLWLAALVYLAAAAAHRAATSCLRLMLQKLYQNVWARWHLEYLSTLQSRNKWYHDVENLKYAAGVACLAASEVAYGAWMAASLAAWWRSAPQAELARRGMDLMHDLKPALLAVERYKEFARPIYDMLEEMEREAPNNAYVIVLFGIVGAALQVAAFIMACRLARRARALEAGEVGMMGVVKGECGCAGEKRACARADDDSDADRDPPPGWRKRANLGMYTILDKIF